MEQYKVYKRNYKQTYLGQVMEPEYQFVTGSWSDIPNSASYTNTDVSSIQFWETNRHYDYLFNREQMRLWYENHPDPVKITTEEEKTLSKHFLAPLATRSLHYTADDQRAHWGRLAARAIETRQVRWERGRAYMSFNLGIEDSTDLGIKSDEYANEWTKYNTTTLFDYLAGTGSFSGSGFPTASYYNSTVGNNILEILRDGLKH